MCGHIGRDGPGRLFAVADLGSGRFKQSGTVAGQYRSNPVQRADHGDPDEDPAPLRTAGARRSRLRLSLPKHVSADAIEEAMQPIDRIFLSIAAHHDSLAPDIRVRTIYPRYLEPASAPGQDGLTRRAFRDGTPYSNEDLFLAGTPNLNARCTRDAATPGMCLSERRIDGADLTFRFPRSWLARWREVANAMERLTVQLHGPSG